MWCSFYLIRFNILIYFCQRLNALGLLICVFFSVIELKGMMIERKNNRLTRQTEKKTKTVIMINKNNSVIKEV